MTVGDFNGDRGPEIVQAYIDPNRNLTLATYRVASGGARPIAEGGRWFIYRRRTLDPARWNSAAGHFTALAHHQIVVETSWQTGIISMGFIDFDPNSIQPQRVTSMILSEHQHRDVL